MRSSAGAFCKTGPGGPAVTRPPFLFRTVTRFEMNQGMTSWTRARRRALRSEMPREPVVMAPKPEWLEHKDVLALLKAEVAKAGSQTAWAKQHRVDRPSVCAALNGLKKTSPQLIKALGLRKIVLYARV
jgi:hypothetical protein